MATVAPFFLKAATKEVIAQIILMLAALLFIVIGTPLHYSLFALPVTLLTLYIGVWIGHRVKATTTHGDLDDIQNVYMENPRCGFWVAELLSSSAEKTEKVDDYHFVREDQLEAAEVERALFGINKCIIGTVAVTIKIDPDMQEPPDSVAWLRRMAVSKAHRRKGVAAALTNVALDHCARANFRAVELLTTEHHQAARNLYANKGFDLINTHHKLFCGGLLSVAMYRLRTPCIHARTHLNA